MPVEIQPTPDPGDRVRRVFLNCPWDDEYKPLLDATILATMACGFVPVSAKESGPTAPRLEKIWEQLTTCGYSIHDLSRSAGRGHADNARANMPLELGMAIARMHAQRRCADAHDWLVLVAKGAHYTEYVSDLGGYDPISHDKTPPGVARAVMHWLLGRPSAQPIVGLNTLLGVLDAFTDKRKASDTEWAELGTPWRDVRDTATGVLLAAAGSAVAAP
jgi:hypothetical protein